MSVDANGLRWWKSSRSSGQGGQCVEVAVWRKSSRSSGQGGNCVEVAATGATWYVRDSKDPDGPILTVTDSAWDSFLTHVRES
jgi:hypothetical protein